MALKKKIKAPHIAVVARAGSGKTFTAIQGAKVALGLPVDEGIVGTKQQEAIWEAMGREKVQDVMILAFNKSIADEAKRKLPEGPCTASTFHALGKALLGKQVGWAKVEQYKTYDLCDELFPDCNLNQKRAISQLISLVKMTLSHTQDENGYLHVAKEDLEALVEHFDLELNGETDWVFEHTEQVLNAALRQNKIIDFDDMIWMPVVLGLEGTKAGLLIVDEAQDLNICRQEFAFLVGERIMIVGDDKQAIYGFAGADTRSMERMIGKLQDTKRGVEVFPLNQTRRCPRSVVALAQQIVNDLEALPEAPEGNVRDIPNAEFVNAVRPGDMVLCRVNAPLLSHVFQLLKMDIPANIQGRDVGQNLENLIRRSKTTEVADLLVWLDNYEQEETSRLLKKKKVSDMQLQALADKCTCIRTLCENVREVAEVTQRIRNLFITVEGSRKGIVLFSSVHRAKGLEAERVFVLCPHLMPHPMAKQPWEREQEMHLKYVAITRAKEDLIFVRTETEE